MTISIIIPIYNVEAYIADCLNSVLAQTSTNYEVICIDDGSTDQSATIARSYQTKFRQIGVSFTLIHQNNHGQAYSRNVGMHKAHGEYILFVDSDDWVESCTIETLSTVVCGEDMVCFNGRLYHETNQRFDIADTMQDAEGLTGWEYYCQHALDHRLFAFYTPVLQLYSKTYLQANNLRFESGILHEDNRFIPLAYYYARHVKVISAVLYNYRIRPNSTMTTVNAKKAKDLIGTANYLAAFFADKQGIDKTTLYRSLTHYYQAPFSGNYVQHERELLSLIDWHCYRRVSRTKPRHRWQYIALRISPRLFRWVNKL